MMDNENQNQPNQKISFESLDILIGKWRDGTFSEIIDDWKWIFSYSKRYKGAIAFYTILGIFSTSMGLVGSVASKYMIDIITGYQMSKLWIMVLITLGSAFFSLTIGNVIGRISTKLSIYINNDIQADIFDKIISAHFLFLIPRFSTPFFTRLLYCIIFAFFSKAFKNHRFFSVFRLHHDVRIGRRTDRYFLV